MFGHSSNTPFLGRYGPILCISLYLPLPLSPSPSPHSAPSQSRVSSPHLGPFPNPHHPAQPSPYNNLHDLGAARARGEGVGGFPRGSDRGCATEGGVEYAGLELPVEYAGLELPVEYASLELPVEYAGLELPVRAPHHLPFTHVLAGLQQVQLDNRPLQQVEDMGVLQSPGLQLPHYAPTQYSATYAATHGSTLQRTQVHGYAAGAVQDTQLHAFAAGVQGAGAVEYAEEESDQEFWDADQETWDVDDDVDDDVVISSPSRPSVPGLCVCRGWGGVRARVCLVCLVSISIAHLWHKHWTYLDIFGIICICIAYLCLEISLQMIAYGLP